MIRSGRPDAVREHGRPARGARSASTSDGRPTVGGAVPARAPMLVALGFVIGWASAWAFDLYLLIPLIGEALR